MKKFLILILIYFLLLIGGPVEVHAQTSIKTITNTRNTLLTNVGEPIDTSMIRVNATIGDLFLYEATLTSLDEAVVFSERSITVHQAGVFLITATHASKQMTIYVVAKLATEDSFTLFEEDFTGQSGNIENYGYAMLDGSGQPGGSAAIATQRLLLSGNTIVLFPAYLQGFSNYIIEMDVNMTQANDPSRWTSVLFRYETENYFQMAVRQNATAANGIEFAKRLSGQWTVPATASFSETLSPAKSYRFKLDVNETTVKEYINDQLMITYDSAYEFTHGRIGVQTNGSTVYFDNIRITLPESYITEERYEFKPVVDVYQPQTGLVAPATVVVWANSLEELSSYVGAVRPATVLMHVDDQLNVVDANGNVILPLLDALILMDGKVIPAFYVSNQEIARQLGQALKQYRIFDVFVASSEGAAILAAREEHSLVRGLLYLDQLEQETLEKEDLIEIRKMTNQAQAVAVVLPIEKLNRELVHYMQARLMTVWVISDHQQGNQYRAILSGANGIVTQDYASIYSIYATFEPNTHVRRPLMIAHRGLYNGGLSSAPENTIEVALEAAAKGADIIELDVHLTLDLEVVVIHDATTIRTAPAFANRTVAQTTLAQLKELNLADPIGQREALKIPTLREFMEAFKGNDVVLFIEIKPTQPLLVMFVMDIIQELDMYDQSVVITFSASNIVSMNEVMPEMANGLLTGTVLNAQSVEASLTNMFANVVTINSTLNPSFGALRPEFAKAIMHRGVTVWPWTINEFSMLAQVYHYGVGGITTDFFSYFDQTFNRLVFENYRFEHVLGESEWLSIRGHIATQSGVLYPLMPEIHVIDDGNTGITFSNNGTMLTVNQTGTFYGYTTFSSNLPDGSLLHMVSDVFIIDVVQPPAIDDQPGSGSILWILVVSGFGLVAACGLGWLLIRKQKKVSI